jgi:hypothetical protein
MVNRRPLLGVLLPLVVACVSDPAPNGSCVVNSALDCGFAVDGGAVASGWDLVGYSCNGSKRPDDAPTIDQGVPQGLVCADRGAVGDSRNFCCTPGPVECALNPVAICAGPEVGYQCRAPSRPEMLNPLVLCHMGIFEEDLLDYCCATPATLVRQQCKEDKGAGCAGGSYRWSCPKGDRPTEEEYTNSESKADFYYLFCSVPTPAPNPAYDLTCCFSQALVPVSGTCLQDRSVPGCAPGRFGVACYGPDTAEDDFPPLKCDPGVSGLSAEGYPATVYCCDMKSAAAT